MKKLISLLLACVLVCALLVSCAAPNNTDTETNTNTGTNETPNKDTNEPSNTDANISTNPGESEKTEPEEKVEIHEKETKKYYRELESSYTTVADGVVYEKDQIFLDGVFEMKKESQYTVLTSHSDLEAFTLLNRNNIEEDIFEDNYVVAILHYYIGASIEGHYSVGFYYADFVTGTISLDRVWKYEQGETCDVKNVYRLHFIVVPKNEIQATKGVHPITVNEQRVEQYSMKAICVEAATEKTTAYYCENYSDVGKIDGFEAVRVEEAFPCVLIHLDKKIETDYIVNGFKYENEEIYITVLIFERTEMKFLSSEEANLLAVSLLPHEAELEINLPEADLTDCKINVIFEKVTAIN